jgi:hypothetical protein
MYLSDFDVLTGNEVVSPKIIWNSKDRYDIIAFLLLSADEKIKAEDLGKLDAFMGITGTEAGDKLTELCSARDAIIKEGNAFLEGISADDNRYDCIVDEIDRVIEGKDNCGIGSGYELLGKTVKHTELDGAAYWLFDYLKLIGTGDGGKGNKKRLLKHLARKWDIDMSTLTSLETFLCSLEEINRKRKEIQGSGMPHNEAVTVLASLDAEEKAIWKKLNALNIAKDRATSAYITSANAVADAIASLGGEPTYVRIRGEDEPPDEDDCYEEETLADKIGDGIVEGIHKVGDLICAPFEWMTEKLMGL